MFFNFSRVSYKKKKSNIQVKNDFDRLEQTHILSYYVTLIEKYDTSVFCDDFLFFNRTFPIDRKRVDLFFHNPSYVILPLYIFISSFYFDRGGGAKVRSIIIEFFDSQMNFTWIP